MPPEHEAESSSLSERTLLESMSVIVDLCIVD